jgi:hypothetical protein
LIKVINLAPLSSYLTQTASLRIKRNIRFVNGLQLIGCLVDVAVFLASLTGSNQAGNLYNPFPAEFQALVLGLYLILPVASVLLSVGKDSDEHFLMLSLILTIFAVALGVVAIAVIFQGYIVLTLPLSFFGGYVLNVPAIVGRGVPMSHVWHRKERGSPVGEYGNLGGMSMEVYVPKISILVVYALVLGLPFIGFLVDVSFQPPISVGASWNVFVILGVVLVSAAVFALVLAHILEGRTGWHEVVLDTYEKKVLWWYDSRGFLIPVRFRNSNVTRAEGNQIRLSTMSRGLGTDLKFSSNSDLVHFLRILNPTRSDLESK